MTAASPGPWIDRDTPDAEPWMHAGGVVKFLEFPVRIAAMSRRAFHLYWQRHHSPHVMNATGFSQFIRKYMTGHVDGRPARGLPTHLRPMPHFEGAAEVWLDGIEEVGSWLGHPLYVELIQPDELRFIDAAGGVEVLIVKEQRLYDPDRDLVETGLVKLYIPVRSRYGLERRAFHRMTSEHGSTIIAQPSLRQWLRRLTVSHRLCEPYPDWLPATDIDAVLELWFDGTEEMRCFFSENAYLEDIRSREAALFEEGSMRAIVTRLHVVHDEFSFQPSTTQPQAFDWFD